MPTAPVNSAWWNISNAAQGDHREEIGWPELVQEVARIRDSLTPEERAHLGIIGTNYGEAGAINLYGPAVRIAARHQRRQFLLVARLRRSPAADGDRDWSEPQVRGGNLRALPLGRAYLEPIRDQERGDRRPPGHLGLRPAETRLEGVLGGLPILRVMRVRLPGIRQQKANLGQQRQSTASLDRGCGDAERRAG